MYTQLYEQCLTADKESNICEKHTSRTRIRKSTHTQTVLFIGSVVQERSIFRCYLYSIIHLHCSLFAFSHPYLGHVTKTFSGRCLQSMCQFVGNSLRPTVSSQLSKIPWLAKQSVEVSLLTGVTMLPHSIASLMPIENLALSSASGR